MMNDGADKKSGRFIKQGSAVMKKVALSEFSFKELRENPAIDYDNADRTIIHTRYHSQTEIESIGIPNSFNHDLSPKRLKRPIIMPTDFTSEWEEERNRSKNHLQREEEFDYQSIREMQNSSDAQAASDDAVPEDTPPDTDKDETAEHSQVDTNHVVSQKPEVSNLSAMAMPNQSTDLSQLSQDINVAAESDAESATQDQMQGQTQEHEIDGEQLHNQNQGQNQNQTQNGPEQTSAETLSSVNEIGAKPLLSAEDPTAEAINDNSGFFPQKIPSSDTNDESDEKIIDPEAQASSEYQQHLIDEPQRAYEKAVSEGFETGFRQGEERAELALQQRGREMFGMISDLVKEFEVLKKEILLSAQDNFVELAQAVCEALVGRELASNPESLGTVINQAIQQAYGEISEKITIRVNPTTLQKLTESDILPSVKKNLKPDESLVEGEFRLQSDLSEVDGRIKNLVSDILSTADLDIFQEEAEDMFDDETEKAS